MKISKVGLRALVLLLAVVALVVFNWNRDPGPSREQTQFMNWIRSLDPAQTRSEAAVLKLSLTGQAAGQTLDWRIAGNDRTHYERARRMLELMSDARRNKIIPVDCSLDIPRVTEVLVFYAADGKQCFYTLLPASDIERSIKLQNFVKLFELAQSTTITTAKAK